MKKFIVGLFACTTLAAGSYAGPVESNYTEAQAQTSYQPSTDLYRDREWNFDLFGAYAFTARPYRGDRYLGVDHAFAGGLDANFMFNRYLGVGVEGYGLAADDVIGQASGNVIFRYPVPGTPLAPYVYAGGGVIFNGSQIDDLIDRGRSIGSIRRRSDAEGMGQFGAGFEYRFTPNFGVIHDFSWNVINGSRNNFGMFRSGIRFAF